MTNTKPILVVGASSPIAKAYAAYCAKAGHPLILADADTNEVSAMASDLNIRYGIQVEVVAFNASDDTAAVELGKFADASNVAVLANFYSIKTERDGLGEMLKVNCLTVAKLFESFIDASCARHRQPTLLAVSSIAGDRGRQSNYPYGASRAALDAYLSGLRNRAYHLGIHVMTIKHGFIKLPEGGENSDSPLAVSAERVAEDIFRASQKKKNTLYAPWFWGIIMWVIRSIPESIFKRLKL